MERKLYIGIDGGGTHSTAVAVWPDGRVAELACGDGLNYHNSGVDIVRSRMEDMVEQLCMKTGIPVENAMICAGMSALDLPADDATTRLFAQGSLSFDQLDLQSDAYAALMGCTLGEPGLIVICGTGSMQVLVDSHGRQIPGGGWGYLLGDAGSSYTLAREGLIAAIDALEGVGSPTTLVDDALSFFDVHSNPRALIDQVYAPDFGPEKLAAFARHVLMRAAEGDPVAYAICERNMIRLGTLAARMLEKDPHARRIGLYGGVFAHNPFARELFQQTVLKNVPDAQFCPVVFPPELGAVIHLLRKNQLLTSTTIDQMKKTSKEIYPS
ncbi:MAG: hypothetical protein IKK75_00325 [Clostridia bacterium]|nr:hypothetical protein [Clostridia bacterium]